MMFNSSKQWLDIINLQEKWTHYNREQREEHGLYTYILNIIIIAYKAKVLHCVELACEIF